LQAQGAEAEARREASELRIQLAEVQAKAQAAAGAGAGAAQAAAAAAGGDVAAAGGDGPVAALGITATSRDAFESVLASKNAQLARLEGDNARAKHEAQRHAQEREEARVTGQACMFQ
jgi:hypothetical protein